MRDADLDRVRALPLFAGLSPDVFRRLLGGAFLQRFPAGTTLLLEGDRVDFLYVLLDGTVELQGAWKDRDTTLAVLRPVSTFILAAVVLDADGLMSALADTPVPLRTMRRGLAEDPASFLFAAAAGRWAAATARP